MYRPEGEFDWPKPPLESWAYIDKVRAIEVKPYLALPFAKRDFQITEGWFYSKEENEIHGLWGHAGIDFGLPLGTEALAAAAGWAMAGYHIRDLGRQYLGKPMKMGLGNFVSIYHPEAIRYTVYGHLGRVADKLKLTSLDNLKVTPEEMSRQGDFVWVERGEAVGTVGDSGFEPKWDEPHLHFEEIARDLQNEDLAKRGSKAAPRDPYDIYWTADKYPGEMGPKQLWDLDGGRPKFVR